MKNLWLLGLLAPFAAAGEVEFRVDPKTQVAVVVNERVPASVEIGEYYCERRGIPRSMVVRLSTSDQEVIPRPAFEKEILGPVAAFWKDHPEVLFVVTTYGVPLKIPETDGSNDKSVQEGFIGGRDFAAVDQELACIPLGTWEIEGILNNPYYNKDEPISPTMKRLVLGRLDAPTPEVARGLVDLALIGERYGLDGKGYLDTRGITANDGYGQRDTAMRQVAKVFEQFGVPFHHDDAPEVIDLSEFDDVVLYYGWYTGNYSFKKNPDFKFRPGAVATHLHSFAASTVRSTSANWVGPLIARGATAAYGTVWEPLTLGFPMEPIFFDRLLSGYTVGEAMAMADYCMSWQAVLVGDPLYAPFAAGRAESQKANREKRGDLEKAWRSAEAAGRLADAWRAARDLAAIAAGLPIHAEATAAVGRLESAAATELEKILTAFRKDPGPETRAALDAFAAGWNGSDAARRASDASAEATRAADAEAETLWNRARKADEAGDFLEARGQYEVIERRHRLSKFAAMAAARLAEMEKDPAVQKSLGSARREEEARRLHTLGLNMRNNGNEASARKYFQRVLDEYGDTSWAEKARKALSGR